MLSAVDRREGVLLVAWTGALVASAVGMAHYTSRPGDDRAPPSALPSALRNYCTSGSKATAWMAMHPHCPCTDATLDELLDIARVAGPDLDCFVLASAPQRQIDDWLGTDLARRAGESSLLQLIPDIDGALSDSIGCRTSGRVVVYGSNQQLLFAGGITPSRGHRGDSIGKRAIFAALRAPNETSQVTTSTFGCELVGPCSSCEATSEPSNPLLK